METSDMTPPSAGRDYNAMTDADFRVEVRAWIEASYSPDIRYPMERLHRRDTKLWFDRLAAKGWLAPRWPREYGGMGLDASKHVIFIEEQERHGCSRVNDQGVLMVGPLLMEHGTKAQIDYFLPRILTGEHLWAQGYSEPNSGSDLASLSTRAELDGEEWVINGQKIWTTLGNDANWMYVLARTDPSAKKQRGISFLLVSMDTPGITVRPLLTLSRHDEFCEVFFDDVRVPKDSLVGPVNGGWTIAKALLGHERIFVGSPAQSSFALGRLDQLARALGVKSEPAFRERYAKLAADLADHSALYATFIEKLRRGERIGAEVSMLKIHQTELYKRIAQETAETAAEAAGYIEASADTGDVRVSGLWIHTLQTTIYGGTSEIQRNILAKQVLGLPD